MMTVVIDDRIKMADSNDRQNTLDDLFELLERMPVPEGLRVEIVEGTIYMSPQRNVHWQLIRLLLRALEDAFGPDVFITSDVRIDFPGVLNGFCPDLAKIRDGAEPDKNGRLRYQDVEFVAEVISRDTARNDYGPKKAAYAQAGVPVYLIADPYQRKCHVYTQPKDGDYAAELTLAFGTEIDLTDTPLDIKIATDAFPHG
jgi:Uma2 family endonuclease